jgi:hypothetical protein
MATRPSSISLKHLAPAVDQAVKAAIQRNPAKVTAGFVINPGIICGPILEETIDLKVAQTIATEITQQVQKAQIGAAAAATVLPKLEPAVLVTRGHIICGFYPFPVEDLNVEQ